MHNIDVKAVLDECGCIHSGEYLFSLKSGRVSSTYICIDPLLTYPVYLHAVSNMLMRESHGFSVVVGPAVGAIPLIYSCAEAVAHRFGNNEIRAAFAEKEGDGFALNRMGFTAAVAGRKAIAVEDISSTGASARATAHAVEAAGGEVIEYRLIWNRDPKRINEKTMGAPVFSLIEEVIESFLPEEHPMWGIWPLVTNIGHPNRVANYPGPTITLL